MKITISVLGALLLILQYHLWIGNGSLAQVWRLNQMIYSQQQENGRLQERNQALIAEIEDLKHGLAAIEERARNDLGMIGKDESFYQLADK